MAKREEKVLSKEEEKHEPDLRGTFISVSILGIFLVVTWIGVWALYLSR